jgi:CRISPR-associated protein Csm4
MLEEQTMRVSVPRWYDSNTDATPFYAERLHFHPEAGLYFFISFRNTDTETRSIIRQSIELLGDSGMGADRSSGNGTFIPEWSQLELETPQQSSHRIMLSLYCPTEEEVVQFVSNNAISPAYSLIKRGGWIASAEDERAGSLRKRSVYMIEEGAVLPCENDGTYRGRLCNLRPSIGTEVGSVTHPVWRDGRAFSLPFHSPNIQP